MAIESFTNYGDFTGDIYEETGVVATTNEVEVSLITGVTATKTADKTHWVNGPLTYTIVVDNASGEAFENVVLTDTLNALIELDEVYGVFINGVKTEDYTYAANLLTVPLGTVADGTATTVTFHVLRA